MYFRWWMVIVLFICCVAFSQVRHEGTPNQLRKPQQGTEKTSQKGRRASPKSKPPMVNLQLEYQVKQGQVAKNFDAWHMDTTTKIASVARDLPGMARKIECVTEDLDKGIQDRFALFKASINVSQSRTDATVTIKILLPGQTKPYFEASYPRNAKPAQLIDRQGPGSFCVKSAWDKSTFKRLQIRRDTQDPDNFHFYIEHMSASSGSVLEDILSAMDPGKPLYLRKKTYCKLS